MMQDMIVYVCPYCGEKNELIINQKDHVDYLMESNERRVRCKKCVRVFNYRLMRELSSKGFILIPEDKSKADRGVLVRDPLRLFSSDFYLGLRAHLRISKSYNVRLTAEYFKKAYEEFPDHWETVFYHALYTAKTNTPIQNLTYYKIFAVKTGLALNIAARTFQGEELKLIVEEIIDECADALMMFESNFTSVVDEFLRGSRDELIRQLVAMDTSIVCDVIADFLSNDPDFYSRAQELFFNVLRIERCFGDLKSTYIKSIVARSKNNNWKPILYARNLYNPLEMMEIEHSPFM